MLKKLLGFIVTVVLLSFTACIDSSTLTPITTGDGSKTSITSQGSDSKGTTLSQNTEVTIENTVVLDQNGLVITAKGFDDDSFIGLGLKLLIENNSDQNMSVQCNSLVVNNYMISDIFSASVAAGKKSNETLYISYSELEAAGIKTISKIAIRFHVVNDDTYKTLFDTDEIELKTSAYGMVEQPAVDDGETLYNENGIRIVGRYVEENSFWGAGVLLFIENNYDEDIAVRCDNMSINGFMVTPFFSCTVNKGRMALDTITIFSSDLEDNDISAVKDIELVFKIYNSDTFKTIDETEAISFSTQNN